MKQFLKILAQSAITITIRLVTPKYDLIWLELRAR